MSLFYIYFFHENNLSCPKISQNIYQHANRVILVFSSLLICYIFRHHFLLLTPWTWQGGPKKVNNAIERNLTYKRKVVTKSQASIFGTPRAIYIISEVACFCEKIPCQPWHALFCFDAGKLSYETQSNHISKRGQFCIQAFIASHHIVIQPRIISTPLCKNTSKLPQKGRIRSYYGSFVARGQSTRVWQKTYFDMQISIMSHRISRGERIETTVIFPLQ